MELCDKHYGYESTKNGRLKDMFFHSITLTFGNNRFIVGRAIIEIEIRKSFVEKSREFRLDEDSGFFGQETIKIYSD